MPENERINLRRQAMRKVWDDNRVPLPTGVGGAAGGSGTVTVTEGAWIDVDGSVVAFDPQQPLLIHAGSPAAAYNTLALAVAAASSGDTIWLPPGTYSGDHTIPASVTLAGMSREDCVLTGEITTSNLTHVENLTIDRDENSSSNVFGLVGPGTDEVAYAKNCTISVTNAGAGEGIGLGAFGKGDFGTSKDDPGLVDCVFKGCDIDIA